MISCSPRGSRLKGGDARARDAVGNDSLESRIHRPRKHLWLSYMQSADSFVRESADIHLDWSKTVKTAFAMASE